ncbi:MAG: A24 family peptidase [Pseudomonadota bacterium]|nr:A24 family peptidase [Pseudomonadota bacterium]
MTLADLFEQNPAFFITSITLLGALVGSFLNVVIHRLPIMMERQWRQQCAEIDLPQISATTEPYNLAQPGSSCPHCNHKIRPWENVPVVSYLMLRGKCSGCGAHISLRYPIIEAVTAALSAFAAWHFGFGWEAAAALLLTWILIPLTVIDIDHQLLPDSITLPFLWVGLLLNLSGTFTDISSAVIGAIVGYLTLWSVYWGFKLLTGKEGMGYGDFKLLALLGAWMGWQMLPLIILLSSLVGAVIGIGLILFRGRDHNIPIPFGPYLAIAGWIALYWGEAITSSYLHMSGIH